MRLLKLREDRKVFVRQDGQLELAGPQGRATLRIDSVGRSMLEALQSGVSLSRLQSFEASAQALAAGLARSGFLMWIQEGATRTEHWLSHLEGDGHAKKLAAAVVAIIGCGGTGSVIADHLARLGIRRFILVDDALLDPPDLNRQLPYLPSDVGRLKVEALADALRRLGAHAVPLSTKLDSSGALARELETHQVSILYCCADTPPIQVQIYAARLALLLQCPVAFGEVGITDYVVGPLLHSDHDKQDYCEWRTQVLRFSNPSNPRTIRASACINNTLAAVEQAWLGVRHLLAAPQGLPAELRHTITVVDITSNERKHVSWKTLLSQIEPSMRVPRVAPLV